MLVPVTSQLKRHRTRRSVQRCNVSAAHDTGRTADTVPPSPPPVTTINPLKARELRLQIADYAQQRKHKEDRQRILLYHTPPFTPKKTQLSS